MNRTLIRCGPGQKAVLSLGAGVQSTALALMIAAGRFGSDAPRLAVFADTGWEPAAVYQHLAWLESELAGAIDVVRVSAGDIRADTAAAAAGSGRFATMPLHLRNLDGEKGQLRRQCTKDYKLAPIRRELRRRGLTAVEMWLGISWDELERMKPSGLRWVANRWPLVEVRLTRTDCLTWLAEHGYPEPPKSACIGCPYMDDRRWLDMREHRPDEWEDACQLDEAIRRLPRIRGDVFLHRTLEPLRSAVLDPSDVGQLALECEGMCGV